MKKNADSLFLLILDQSENTAEKLVSLLRNAGIATRAQHVESEEAVLEALNGQTWELLIVRESSLDFDLSSILKHIKHKDLYTPLVLLSEKHDADQLVAHLKAGVHDVVVEENEKHLVQVVKRELSHIAEHQKLRRLELEVKDIEHRCELLLDSSKDAIAYINDGMHIYANNSYLQLLGYDDLDEMICIPVLDTLAGNSVDMFKNLIKELNEKDIKSGVADINVATLREDGTEIGSAMSLSQASYDGEACLQVILRPEADSAQLEERLKEMSQVDVLTGLYNRHYFMDALHGAKEKAQANSQQYAALYIAIDNFQSIKTNLGIADADIALHDLAEMLKQKHSDKVCLARLSDDVFGLICKTEEKDALEEMGRAILKDVEDKLFEVEGTTIQMTLSIGATIINANAPTVKDILGRAQTASDGIYQKESTKNGNAFALYQPETDNALGDHDKAMEMIQNALADNQFKLLFQPVISLRGQTSEHYEAFIRMIDSEGQEVSPYDFLPPSGPSELAARIDKWVVLQTIKHLSEHRSQGHDTQLFINLTAETLQDNSFTSWLNVALKAARLPGDSLIFQISEAHAISYLKHAKEFEKGLGTLHCKLSVNQFGRALNPFNLLKHLSPQYIKLEGTFTQEMQKGPEEKEAVKELISTLQSMNKLTIVPLVESASLLSTLWQAGVNYIQGYYLQAPASEMNYDFSEDN